MSFRNLVSGPIGDVTFIIGFAAFFTVPLFIYVLLVAMGRRELPAISAGGAGRRLLGPVLIGYYYWMLGPLLRFVGKAGIRPNQITAAALGGAALTAAAIATGHFALASTLLIADGTLDIIDGQVARSSRRMSASGAFFDSTVDRVSDGLVFGGCVIYYARTPVVYLALFVMIATFTVSYARARGETLGVFRPEGLLQRAERITILGIALAFSPIVGHRDEGFVPHPFYGVTVSALCLLALLGTVTAVARIRWTMARLDAAGETTSSASGTSGALAPPLRAPRQQPAFAALNPSEALGSAAGEGARLFRQRIP